MGVEERKPNKQLRYQRELRGWSQKRVGIEIDTSKDVVSRWETGHKTPSPYYQEKLCALFGVTAEELGFMPALEKEAIAPSQVGTQIDVSLLSQAVSQGILAAVKDLGESQGQDMDKLRRQLLNHMLGIVGSTFSLSRSALTPFSLSQGTHPAAPSPMSLMDSEEYRQRLHFFWARWSACDSEQALVEILTRIATLQETLIYGSTGQREQVGLLLCQYLILYGNIRRDQGYSDSAIAYFDKAVKLALEKHYDGLAAKALYLKGYAQFDIWGIQADRIQERTNLMQASLSFQTALQWAHESQKHAGTNGPLMSAIAAELGLVQAYCAQTAEEKTCALRMIDQAGSMIQSHDFYRDPLFLHVNDEWYHIDKAEAYIALQWEKNAIAELENIDRSNSQKRRRYVYADIVEADAHLTEGQVEMSVACAENALELLTDMESSLFVKRIANIYQALKQDEKCKKCPDVARLGGKLLKIQHPYLFTAETQQA